MKAFILNIKSGTAIPRLVRVMRPKKMAFALTEFALIEVEYM